jgi:serine/threonine-protein kinase
MLVGRELGPYVVEKELGSGAMGTVFRAKHKKTGQKVAVKIVSASVANNPAALARFTRECAILKQLQHPNIVKYLGSGRVHGTPFYIMEYVEGESLDHVMARRDRMTWEEVVELGVPLCDALQHAHDKGIIHRDLKPSNLMILRDGTVKLTDFGIAKDTDVTALTAANSTVGTAAYMSPEQCKGTRDLTHKSDLYSLGVMFYELITGKKPFKAETIMEMFLKHANEEAPRASRLILDLPVWMDNLICQLMEKSPEQRPYNASTVGTSLQAVKEKVEAQLSAGVDAAKKRRIDKSTRDVALDDTDKDAARQLLGKKKKKKKKADPFYRKGWFTIAALGGVVLALVAGVYVVFIKAPDPDRLYGQAEAIMKAGRFDEQRTARKEGGPIADFLYYHPTHPKASQVQQWADRIDAEDTETALLSRRRVGMKAPEKEEKVDTAAREALDLEELGRLGDAARRWGEMAKEYKKSPDPDLRSWGLLGDKRQRDLQSVAALYDELQRKEISERMRGQKDDSGSPAFLIGLEAARAEQQGDKEAARKSWKDLQQLTAPQKDSAEQRRFYLLASQRLMAEPEKTKETQ